MHAIWPTDFPVLSWKIPLENVCVSMPFSDETFWTTKPPKTNSQTHKEKEKKYDILFGNDILKCTKQV